MVYLYMCIGTVIGWILGEVSIFVVGAIKEKIRFNKEQREYQKELNRKIEAYNKSRNKNEKPKAPEIHLCQDDGFRF